MSSHYDTLGVQPSSNPKDIRKAYLRRARALHPDRQQGRSAADARRAEDAMRQVNVAWNVLSNTQKKTDYDRQLSPQNGTQRTAQTQRPNQQRPPSQRRPTTQGGPAKNPQRPRMASSTQPPNAQSTAAKKHSIDDEPGDGSVSVWASLPVLLIVGIALGILLITAFGNQNGPSENREVVPELDSQIRNSNCFVFLANGDLQQAACSSGRADAEVVDIVPDPGNCPAGSESVTQGEVVLCYRRLIAGSTIQVNE